MLILENIHKLIGRTLELQQPLNSDSPLKLPMDVPIIDVHIHFGYYEIIIEHVLINTIQMHLNRERFISPFDAAVSETEYLLEVHPVGNARWIGNTNIRNIDSFVRQLEYVLDSMNDRGLVWIQN